MGNGRGTSGRAATIQSIFTGPRSASARTSAPSAVGSCPASPWRQRVRVSTPSAGRGEVTDDECRSLSAADRRALAERGAGRVEGRQGRPTPGPAGAAIPGGSRRWRPRARAGSLPPSAAAARGPGSAHRHRHAAARVPARKRGESHASRRRGPLRAREPPARDGEGEQGDRRHDERRAPPRCRAPDFRRASRGRWRSRSPATSTTRGRRARPARARATPATARERGGRPSLPSAHGGSRRPRRRSRKESTTARGGRRPPRRRRPRESRTPLRATSAAGVGPRA